MPALVRCPCACTRHMLLRLTYVQPGAHESYIRLSYHTLDAYGCVVRRSTARIRAPLDASHGVACVLDAWGCSCVRCSARVLNALWPRVWCEAVYSSKKTSRQRTCTAALLRLHPPHHHHTTFKVTPPCTAPPPHNPKAVSPHSVQA